MIHEVSGVYTSPFSDTDDLKMALRARKLSGAFEKRAPGPQMIPRSELIPPQKVRNGVDSIESLWMDTYLLTRVFKR